MSKGLYYFLGLITGVLLTVVGIMLLGLTKEDSADKVYFDKPGTCIYTDDLHVLHVVDNYSAIALADYQAMLIENPKGEYFYDGQTIKCPKGNCMRQVGVFKYLTTEGYPRTIPIVRISKK